MIEKTALIIMGLSLKLLCVDIEVEVKGVVPTLGQRVAHNRPRTISSIREMHLILRDAKLIFCKVLKPFFTRC